MGRSNKKDIKEILHNSCMLFWNKGYAQTSIKDIEKATGLNPGSLYYYFKNKEVIFEKVLEHYVSTVVEPRLKEFLFTTKGNGLNNIQRVFDSVVEIPSEYRWIGCLMTNTSVEVQEIPKIKKKIQTIFDLFESGFLKQINRVSVLKTKTLLERRKLAGYLLVAMEGFFVLVRLQNDTAQLKKYVSNALYPLKSALK
ncbi:MAG TPA: TetR/AcrR family transcriptional regulator [Candidatus Udaeobacter sp.]|nr:TetR/AcrR family transcriptional regulator [Candidatus Udaeobacter sp.]